MAEASPTTPPEGTALIHDSRPLVSGGITVAKYAVSMTYDTYGMNQIPFLIRRVSTLPIRFSTGALARISPWQSLGDSLRLVRNVHESLWLVGKSYASVFPQPD